MGKVDLLIKNGRVLDTAAGIDDIGCIAVHEGKSLGLVSGNTAANKIINASGCFVLPGLIDFHTHLDVQNSSMAVDPNFLLPLGVTTAADAGTSGSGNFHDFYNNVIAKSKVTVCTFLNVSANGQPGGGINEDFDPEHFSLPEIKDLVDEYPGQIRGLKIRMESAIMGQWGLAPLIRAKEISTQLGLPLVVHAANPPAPEAELLAILGSGDILCHCYHGKNEHTILDDQGKVRPEVWAARERGVLFDMANGVTNYNHDVAISALADGFLPDIVSSDLCDVVFNNDGYGKSLPYTMSKMLCLGMSIREVVRATTEIPAVMLGLEGKAGTLAESAWGDITILKAVENTPIFLDNFGKGITGNTLLVPQMTIKSGNILFRQCDF